MHSLSPEYIAKLRFNARQLAMLRTLGEQRGRQPLHIAQLPEVLNDVRRVAIADSIESSTRLNGVTVAGHRLKSLALEKVTPQNRAEQEIAGYRDALKLICDGGDRMPLSESIVLQLHATLHRYMRQPGGQWRTADSDIIEGLSGYSFHPVAAHLTPVTMESLVARYRTALDQQLADPLVLVPLVIFDFLCIHPFPDNNCRMARLLSLQLLCHFDYAVGRFISLERIFENSKEDYCTAVGASLQGWHEGIHNITPWFDYFWGTLARAYEEFEDRIGTIERGRGAKGDRVRTEILKHRLPFSISEIEKACPGVSRDMVRLTLRTMKAEGLIEPTGKGRNAKWQHTQNR
ncbi:filamentation induced by cAMP protein Fic [Acidovorax sp. JS42]|uniref:Fic family protein n=1 Tax=Diaphorobacter sp. MNS-0 TaxID=2866628 RepID=UPI0000DCB764|nr:Fic family protein [Diaphorobacter sp. MNS-0]ABM41076.1 filamentation induced by cAMP protein Fic [Acidovorax sp. JS42]QYY26416.1 Fic family protein [Diaphorobacter sp. MNS-0]